MAVAGINTPVSLGAIKVAFEIFPYELLMAHVL
jgi:hypothetical protein